MPILAGPGAVPRLLGPDDNNRLVYIPTGSTLRTASGLTATVYADAAGLSLADIAAFQPGNPDVPGASIVGSVLTVGSDSQLPQFWYPESADTVWVRVGTGTLVELHADYDTRLDNLSNLVLAGETPAGAQAKANAAQAAAAGDATGKANAAISAAATDATTKANAAQANAISAAATDATAKASAAVGTAAGLAIVFGGL